MAHAESRWTPARWWPVLAGRGRWTPPAWWPVVAATARVAGRACAPEWRRPSDRRWPAHDELPWPARCVAATSPVARAPEPAVVCGCPRRCSCRRKNMRSSPTSTSRPATCGGRFSGVHQWPVLGVHRGRGQRACDHSTGRSFGPQTAGLFDVDVGRRVLWCDRFSLAARDDRVAPALPRARRVLSGSLETSSRVRYTCAPVAASTRTRGRACSPRGDDGCRQ